MNRDNGRDRQRIAIVSSAARARVNGKTLWELRLVYLGVGVTPVQALITADEYNDVGII